MRLFKGLLSAGLAVALCALSTAANASSVPVFEDSIAGFVNAKGTTTGAALVSTSAFFLDINLAPPTSAITASIAANITPTVLPGGKLTDGTATKEFKEFSGTTLTNDIILDISINKGSVVAGPGVLSFTGLITKLVVITGGTSVINGYDFQHLVGGMTTFADNSTTVDFSTLYKHNGVIANHGVLSVTEVAVPEPSSMALLGIGMAGFFTYRRLFKRAITA
jgi:hypothetical protein